MKQYSTDLRERLVGALDAGFRPTEAAQYFGVTTRTMSRWRQRRRLAGTTAPLPRPGRTPKIAPERDSALRARRRLSGRHPRRAVRALVRRHRRAGQPSNDVAAFRQAGDHA
jgi:transposase-like protein